MVVRWLVYLDRQCTFGSSILLPDADIGAGRANGVAGVLPIPTLETGRGYLAGMGMRWRGAVEVIASKATSTGRDSSAALGGLVQRRGALAQGAYLIAEAVGTLGKAPQGIVLEDTPADRGFIVGMPRAGGDMPR